MNNKELESKVNKICDNEIITKKIITTINVLLELDYLSTADLNKWYKGEVGYLESVCTTNLSKLSLISKVIRKYANDNNLKSSFTFYKMNKTKKQLVFSKTKNENIEKSYATHYIRQKTA